MQEAAQATGAPGLVCHAYYMRSVGQTSIGDPEGGARVRGARPRRPRSTAGARPRSRRPTTPGPCRWRAAIRRARWRCSTAASEHGEAVGNRWIRAFALTESLWIRARAGRGRARRSSGYRDVIDTWFRGSDWANQWLSLRYVFAILESLGRDEAAAMLYGALEAAGVMQALPLEPSNADEFAHAVERLSARLDPTVFADAVERGRILRDDELVRAVLREIDSPTTLTVVVREVDGERRGPGELVARRGRRR